MTVTNENMKTILRLIKEEELVDSYMEIDGIDEKALKDIILRCESKNYIVNMSGDIITKYSYDWEVNPKTKLTEAGYRFLNNEPEPKQEEKPTTVVNMGNVTNAQIGGNNNTFNVNYNNSIDELKEVVNQMSGENKKIGEELITLIQEKEVEKGSWKKFASFILNNQAVNAVVSNIALHLLIS